MRPRSSNSDGPLLNPLFASPDTDRELSDEALLSAMLDAETALAHAESAAGVIPAEAARAIADTCSGVALDIGQLGRDAQAGGNPVVPLVRALGAELPESARAWVHYATTSQDILDTALALVARRCGTVLLHDADDAAQHCAELAARHRGSVMAARTLGQQAGISSFGLKAAGWMTSIDHGSARLHDVLSTGLAVQLGGATGTLAMLGDAAPAVLERFAELLGLAQPLLPWHTDRVRTVDLATAVATTIAACGKVALDVVVLAQTEIGELAEGTGSARSDGHAHGGSSALPHKHNPIDAVLIRSAAIRTPGLVSTILMTAAQQENERAAGGWHAEWEPMRELLSIAGGALHRTASLLAKLDVRSDRMQENVDASGGLLFAEHVSARLMPAVGRSNALSLVASCCETAVARRVPLREVMASDDEVLRHLSVAELDELFSPAVALRAAGRLVDRALAAHASRAHAPRDVAGHQ